MGRRQTKRRKNNCIQHGSLQKVFVHGRDVWRVQYRDEHLILRTKVLGTCEKMSRLQAEDERSDLMKAVRRSIHEPKKSTRTFDEFVENEFLPWIAPKWKESTYESACYDIRRHLVRELDRQPIGAIRRTVLQGLINRKAKEGLSESTLKHLQFWLKQIFDLAMSEGLINLYPAELYLPRDRKRPVLRPDMSPEHFAKAIEVLPQPYKLEFALNTLSELRISEVLALRIGEIDTKLRRLTVDERYYRGVLDDPKSQRGNRHLGMGDWLIECAQEWISQLPGQAPDAWVFPSPKDPSRPMSADWVRKQIKHYLTKVGLEWATPHCGRLSGSKALHASGIEPRVAAAVAGHGVKVSQNVYDRISQEERQAAAEAAERYFRLEVKEVSKQ